MPHTFSVLFITGGARNVMYKSSVVVCRKERKLGDTTYGITTTYVLSEPGEMQDAMRECFDNSAPAGAGRRQDVGGPDAPSSLAPLASAIGEMREDDHL